MKDYYKILDIDKTSTQEDIKKAYKNLALLWHPDKNNSPEAPDRFKEISEAYQILSNPSKKEQYDMGGQTSFSQFGNYSYKDPFEMFNEMFSVINNLFGGLMPQNLSQSGVHVIHIIEMNDDANDENNVFDIIQSIQSQKKQILHHLTPDTRINTLNGSETAFGGVLQMQEHIKQVQIQMQEQLKQMQGYSPQIQEQLKQTQAKMQEQSKQSRMQMSNRKEQLAKFQQAQMLDQQTRIEQRMKQIEQEHLEKVRHAQLHNERIKLERQNRQSQQEEFEKMRLAKIQEQLDRELRIKQIEREQSEKKKQMKEELNRERDEELSKKVHILDDVQLNKIISETFKN